MTRIAGADKILQHGCDETGIDGTGTYNQWAMIEDGDGVDIVIIEAGAVLVDGTAEGCAQHVKTSFARGQRAVLQCLHKCIELCGEEAAKEIVPIKRGGVKLLKMCSTMNDTCPTARLVAEMLERLSNESGVEEHGAEVWAGMDEHITHMLVNLCANHSRNLPVDAFNRLFTAHVTEELGVDIKKCVDATGGQARLEKDGVALIRAVCKLAHSGYGQHATREMAITSRTGWMRTTPAFPVKAPVVWS